MCRKKKTCTELSVDHNFWSKTAPLQPLEWFTSQLDLFQKSVELLINGERDNAIKELQKIRNRDMRDWYINHGQMSGDHRARQLKLQKPASIEESLRDSIRSPKKYELQVFTRDGFRCRYCGIRLLSKELLKTFIKVLNSNHFRKGPRNINTHGIIHIFNPVADHVVPWRIGGKTNLDNLVTSCGACNYGKAGYTLEQIGLNDPNARLPVKDNWDGLDSKTHPLQKILKAKLKRHMTP